MTARRGVLPATLRLSLLAALALAFCVVTPARSDDAPTAGAAIEKARALARQGRQSAAESYLAELVKEEGGPHSGNAAVLLEAARLSSSAENCRAYAVRAVERTRDSQLLEEAHTLMGDSYFAESLYVSAGMEYERAARHSDGRGPGLLEIKRARSILASGDAGAAVEAFREIAEWGPTPGDLTPTAEIGLARALLAAGDPEEAAAQFERTARVFDATEVRARALAGAAESHEAAGEDAEAVAALRRLLVDCPDSFEAVLARERLRAYALSDSSFAMGEAADTTAVEEEPPESPGQ